MYAAKQCILRQYWYFCTRKASKLSIRQPRLFKPRRPHNTHVSIRQHTSAYVSGR